MAIEEIRALLEDVAASGTAILLVEQNVKLVQSLCQRAWVLAHGTVKDSGPVAELLEGARVADAYLGGLDLIEDDDLPQRSRSAPLRGGTDMITSDRLDVRRHAAPRSLPGRGATRIAHRPTSRCSSTATASTSGATTTSPRRSSTTAPSSTGSITSATARVAATG